MQTRTSRSSNFLENHPRIRIGLHTSGPLAAVDRAPSPSAISGACAPWWTATRSSSGAEGSSSRSCSSIPEVDRRGQIAAMADWLELELGRRPRGLWLTERVWEPGLASSLSAAGRRVHRGRRRPLRRRRIRARPALGPLPDRGPGAQPQRAADPSRAALPDSVRRRPSAPSSSCDGWPRGRGSDRGAGRRRREVRRVAGHAQALLRGASGSSAGRPSSRPIRGSRSRRRPKRSPATLRSGSPICRPLPITRCRNGRCRPAAQERYHRAAERLEPDFGERRARPLARRPLAQLPGPLPGIEPPPQAHAPRLAPPVAPPRRGRPAVEGGAHAALALAVQLSLLARGLRRALPAASSLGGLSRADRRRRRSRCAAAAPG